MRFIIPHISICLVASMACTCVGIGHLRTVAVSGDDAPGTQDGVYFGEFLTVLPPTLNSSGNVAFYAELTGSGVNTSNNSGVWSEGMGSLQLAARTGEPAPGTAAGVFYRGFDFPLLNSQGITTVRGSLTGSGINNSNNVAIWSGAIGSLSLVARMGDPAPGTASGAQFSSLTTGNLRLNSAGKIVFPARISGGDVSGLSNAGIWSYEAGSLQLGLRGGVPSTELPSGVLLTNPLAPVLNDNGHVAFMSDLAGVGIGGSNNRAMWLIGSNSIEIVAREGDHAPGLPTAIKFVDFEFSPSPVLNSAGQVAFTANIEGPGIDSSNNRGIWMGLAGAPQLLARTGDPAIPISNEVMHQGLFAPVLNVLGQVAFGGTLIGENVDNSNREVIWSNGFGLLHVVARSGEHAPGTPQAVNFSSVGFGIGEGNYAINSAGQVAFLGQLTGDGVQSANNEGIWAEDRSGKVWKIAREGDELEVAIGDFRTIRRLSFRSGSGGDDGRPNGFNGLGQLAFCAEFTDGTSGIFISDLATLPEPATLLLMIFSVALLATSRFRDL